MDTVINYLKLNKINEAREFVIKNEFSADLKNDLNILILLKTNIGVDNLPKVLINKNNSNLKYKYLYYLNTGLIEYHHNQNAFEAFNNIEKSLKIAQQINNKTLINESLRNILEIYCKQSDLIGDKFHLDYLKIYKDNIYDTYELSYYKYYKFKLDLINSKFTKANHKDYLEINSLLKKNKFHFLKNLQNISNASYQYRILKNIDSAFFYLNSFGKLNKNNPNELIIINSFKLNKAKYLLDLDSLKKSEKLLNSIKFNKKGYLNNNSNTYLLDRKWALYNKNGQNDSSLFYSNLYLKSTFLNNLYQTQFQIADLKTKYKSIEKEKQIIIEQQKNKQNKNLLIGSTLFILFGGTIAFLTLKNSKKKQKLAEQEKALETQKNLTLLKEQELTTINAMVDGQEKERKRIAEDLHDNLGSVLATLKLHFENLKMNREKKKINQETLFDKTESLIDDAYLKVRSIAHAKNAGVLANQGLLTAIQMMAEKISSADNIQIEVIDFGLNKRLENSLEITVFRIIQELITNTIKHANAKNATINISLYDKNLNIIIEDNGKGFEFNKEDLEKGMGLNSIITRINHLNGVFEVDSTLGKGSSIIIDIPIS